LHILNSVNHSFFVNFFLGTEGKWTAKYINFVNLEYLYLDINEIPELPENIDKLINSKSGISLYQDLGLKALKLELQELEFELNHKNIEFTEIEKLIHNFDLRQSKELGSIIEKIWAKI